MIIWDDPGIGKVYANIGLVEGGKEEISIVFGVEQARQPDLDQTRVQLTDRIIFNPLAAKRFAAQLENRIREYESHSGRPGPVLTPVEEAGVKPPSKQDDPGKMPAPAEHLISLMMDLGIETGMERSFKVVDQKLLKNRFIVGFKKDNIFLNPDMRIIEICRRIHMPESLLSTFTEHLPDAGYIHFGFEESETSCVYKVYLEFWEKLKQTVHPDRLDPGGYDLHLGFKWDVSDPSRCALTRYIWHPWISGREIIAKVDQIIPGAWEISRKAAKDLVSAAGVRIPDRDILFLEVIEEDNARRSFDINVYRADLQVAEVYSLLSVLCRSCSLPYDVFHSFYQGIRTKQLGHLAAGLDRRGKPFFTLYYGVEPLCPRSPLMPRLMPQEEKSETLKPSRYAMSPGKKRRVRVEETDEHAGRLYRLVDALGYRAAFERSFKFMEGILLTGRFLMGFRRQDSTPGQDEAVLNVCRRIGMPEDHLEKLRSELTGADIVLFGFEANEKNRVYKVYLEFNARLVEASKQDPPPDKVHIHTGFKWDVSDNSRKAVATYAALPLFRAADIAKRVGDEFYGGKNEGVYRMVDDILDLAGSRTRPGELLYFEASEENNPRSSYDVKLYRTNLRMAEIYPVLVGIARHYAVRMGVFDEIYEAVKTHRFGHLTGGTDREGRDFLTLYFAERLLPVEPPQA